jgi:hypothetical protein
MTASFSEGATNDLTPDSIGAKCELVAALAVEQKNEYSQMQRDAQHSSLQSHASKSLVV